MEKFASEYKIIILDDETIVTSSLNALLMIEADYSPFVFNTPEDALSHIEKNGADLVISDFLMPSMNGIDFLKKVKEITPEASLILLTGYADKENAIKSINEIGLYRYLEKPWDNDDLLLCIKNGLEKSNLQQKLQEKISELSEAKQQLSDYNKQLEITIKERTSELVNTNKQLEKANAKLSSIINHCADGIAIISQDGNIAQVNPAFEKFCGLNKTKLENQNFNKLFIHSLNYSICNEIKSNEDVLIKGYNLIKADNNRTIPVEISFAPISSINYDEIKHYVGVIRDITIQQDMERLRDDFIATLTHDLRTPLLAAIQTLKFFLDGTLGELNERQSKFLATMLLSNQDMLGLVNALLEVYKYESGKLVLCKDFFELNGFINQCAQEIQVLTEQKNIELKISNISCEKVFADKQELKRVLANLLGNAINYTPLNGKIVISGEYTNEEIIITIEDNGTGIPKEDIALLFTRFSQGTSKKRSTGTGLGLYLSRQIVEAHGGKIWLESEVGVGSKFKYSIPRKSSN